MKVTLRVLALAFASAGACHGVSALESVSAVDAAASGPMTRGDRAVRPIERGQATGTCGSDEHVIPQISVPLKRGNAKPTLNKPKRAGSTSGAVDDDAARCQAMTSTAERAGCEAGQSGRATDKGGQSKR